MKRSPTAVALACLLALASLLIAPTAASAQRLPDVARPEHYTLWFAPDLQKATFRGRETIRVRVMKPTTTITLHAAEITFGAVKIATDRPQDAPQDATVTLHPESETATLTVPQPIPAGAASIEITYAGILNDKLRGFYLSKANNRAYAVSQMEATDARRAFPSFDEPMFKATFDVSLMIDQGDMAISNGAQVSDTPGPETGKHTVTFATTKKMSTYLVALLVGDFACREAKADSIPVRVCSTPDKKALTGYALEAATQQLRFYNEYYGIPYPFGKLDIIGVPDFSAGAMENTGAITFREQYLLADPQRASLSTKQNVESILSHEIAHQWFGDLVTMKWWDDIWLNEGFATWMANKPLEAAHPDWEMHLRDVADTQTALGLDALRSTRAIRTKVETPEQINEVFDAIAYQKSAAVLRMIETFVGRDVFRKGVGSYLQKYSYSNAAAEDFWTEVARVSGKPVDRIMKSYVDQPGVPVLRVTSRCRGSSTELTLQQERFIGMPDAKPESPQAWTIPICSRTRAGGPMQCQVIAKPQETISVPGCADGLFVNAGSSGYFVTEYAPEAVAAFSRKVETTLTPAERIGLLGDEWWMMRSGRHDVSAILDLAAALADDRTPEIVGSTARRVAYAASYLVDDTDRPTFQSWIRAKFGPALDRLGLIGSPPNEKDDSRRASLLGLVGMWGDSREVQQQARQLATKYVSDPSSLPATLASAVLGIAAYGDGDAALYDQYLARLKATAAEPEEHYRYFAALGDFREPALIDRTLAYAMSPDVRTQDAGFVLAGLLSEPWSRDRAWAFVQKEWPRLTERLDTFQGLPTIVNGTSNFCSADAAAQVKQFFAEHPLPTAERTIQQAIEKINGCAALKARQGPALKTWLRQARSSSGSAEFR